MNSSDVPLILDRLLSATHSVDVRSALETLTLSFNGTVNDEINPETGVNKLEAQANNLFELANALFADRAFVNSLCMLLTSCTLPEVTEIREETDSISRGLGGGGLHVEDGRLVVWAVEILIIEDAYCFHRVT